ncbi:hypothetical protein JCM6882_004415 [Rhodosporidiobolus microsporus]
MFENLEQELHDFALLHGVIIGSPPPGPRVPSRVGNFDLVTKHRLDVPPYTTIAKWRSRESGLSVVWADTPGPVARLWATVVTEIFNSSGEPHTKEHLTFTASKHFKYSGILDSLANRMFTNGTNAYTQVDNTTYTFESCSEQGFLTVLPVYLDHILFPLMDASIFKTEVFHIDGKGEEGGVVFSEMQGREGSQEDVMDRALSETLYDLLNGYRSETGGQLDALRKLTIEDIKDFHRQAYAPQNVTVVVAGQAINPERLLQAINSTAELNIAKEGLAKGVRPRGWIRPLVESSTAKNPPVIAQDIVKKVAYPASDESVGVIQIAWVGPHAHDWLTCAALEAIFSYMAGSSSSPLAKRFVETANPACSGIDFSIQFRDPTTLNVCLSAVPADQLPHLGADFLDALEHLSHEPINMKRLRGHLERTWLGLLQTLETNAETYVQEAVVQDILYGAENGADLKDAFGDLKMLRKLMLWTPSDWISLLRTWIVKPHNLTLVGTPSAALVEQHALENKARVNATKKRLGKAGLAKLAMDLEEAKSTNEHPAPPSVIEAFKIPGDDIAWLQVETARSNGVGRGKETYHNALQDKINRDGGGVLPYFVQFDHYESNFITISVFLHGPPLPIYPLWNDSFFAMPVRRHDGTMLSFDKANRKLDQIAITRDAGTADEGILVTLQVVKKNYAQAIAWLSDIIYGTQYDVERLHNLLASAVENLPSEKEDGDEMARAVLNEMFFSTGSFQSPANRINLLKFYPAVKERLERDPQSVVKELEDMRHAMVDPRALRIHVSGDILGLSHPVKDWLKHFERVPTFPPGQLAPVLMTCDLLTPLGKHPCKKGIVVVVPSSESTYVYTRSKAPAWSHPDYVAIDVATTILSAMNSYLWKACRGPGLCYGAGIGISDKRGNIALTIFKSPDAFAAFSAAKRVVADIASGKTRIAQADVDAAHSSMIYALVSGLDTSASVASFSFFDSVLHNRPSDYMPRTLQRIKSTTAADVERVVKQWLLPLFDPATSIFGASGNAEKAAQLVRDFTKAGYEVEQRTL